MSLNKHITPTCWFCRKGITAPEYLHTRDSISRFRNAVKVAGQGTVRGLQLCATCVKRLHVNYRNERQEELTPIFVLAPPPTDPSAGFQESLPTPPPRKRDRPLARSATRVSGTMESPRDQIVSCTCPAHQGSSSASLRSTEVLAYQERTPEVGSGEEISTFDFEL
jgi:hypothetical protein